MKHTPLSNTALQRLQLPVIALLLSIAAPIAAAKAVDGVAATVKRPVHPVLIRNEHGPLMRVVIEVAENRDVAFRDLTVSLAGTDDLADLDSLALFFTQDQEPFSPASPLGEPQRPAETIAFRGEQPLRPGKNVFWLSCRLKDSADLQHQIVASCTSIATSVGTVTPRDEVANARHRIGVALRKHNDDGVHTYRIPALTTTPKGTLLCVYDMRRRMGRDLQEDIDIGLSRSTDGGATWEPIRVIMDMGEYGGLPQEQNGCSDPGIIVDRQTGEVFCFAVWMNGKPGKHQWNDDGSEPGFEIGKAAQFMLVRSQDDGLTWSQPENLTRKLKQEAWWLLAPSPQQGINLPDGTLVMPVEGRDETGETCATLMISRDHGATWTVAKSAFSGGNECQAAQLGDGLTSGVYRLQVRIREADEVPGSTVRYADIRYAQTGVELIGLPKHSPLLGEAAEDEGTDSSLASNNSFDMSATTPGNRPQELGNLFATDQATLSVAGALSSSVDVDFYTFDVTYENISNPSAHHGSLTFDLDYADGLSRANTTVTVFDSSGVPILIARDSNIAEDRPAPVVDPLDQSGMYDLSRGTVGEFDPFIGTVEMPQGTYYVAVCSWDADRNLSRVSNVVRVKLD